MFSYERLTSVTPIGFREKEHHSAFKYWKGYAVETARRIVGEIVAKENCSKLYPPGRLRTEFATCSQQANYNIYCSCCRVGNVAQTLLCLVGNLIAPYCDPAQYSNSGMDFLENYSDVAPQDWDQPVEVANLWEILSDSFAWPELVRRIYCRRHWVAVREIAYQFVRTWQSFFEELAQRKQAFSELEKRDWNKVLFEPSLAHVYEGELLLNAETMAQFALQNIAKMIEVSDSEEITAAVIANLNQIPNSQIHCKWSYGSQSPCRRRAYIETIVGNRERHRRATNLLRKLYDPEMALVDRPSRKFSSAYSLAEFESPFRFSYRELLICAELVSNPKFNEEAYWPIVSVDAFTPDYRHTILNVPGEKFPEILEATLLDLGELSNSRFVVAPPEEPLDPAAVVAFLVESYAGLVTQLEEVCSKGIATDLLTIAVKHAPRLTLVQLCANVVEEAETQSWQCL